MDSQLLVCPLNLLRSRWLADSKRPVKRSFGTPKSRHEILERNRGSPIGEDGVKVKDAVEFVHDFFVGWPVHTSVCSAGIAESKA